MVCKKKKDLFRVTEQDKIRQRINGEMGREANDIDTWCLDRLGGYIGVKRRLDSRRCVD